MAEDRQTAKNKGIYGQIVPVQYYVLLYILYLYSIMSCCIAIVPVFHLNLSLDNHLIGS